MGGDGLKTQRHPIDGLDRGPLERGGEVLYNKIHELPGAEIFNGRGAQHAHKAARLHACLDARRHFIVGKLLSVQVLLHELFA